MIDEHFLREKIQLLNYHILTTASSNRNDLKEEIPNTINQLLGTVVTAIYKYDSSIKGFRLITKSTQNNRVLLNHVIFDYDYHYRNSILEEKEIDIGINELLTVSTQAMDFNVIPLNPADGSVGLIVMGFDAMESTMPNVINDVLKEETEKVLRCLHKLSQFISNKERNEVLYEMISQFLTLTSKSEIIEEVILSLNKVFPDYQYHLLLSQDHDMEGSLPVKLLDMHDAKQTFASKAFLTSKIQVENKLEENQTIVYAPLKGHQGVYGILEIIIPQNLELPKEEIVFISKFSHSAGKALESITLYQNSRHLVSDLKLINDLTHQLNSNLELTEITKLVRDQIIKVCQPEEIGFVYKMQEKSNHFETLGESTTFFDTIEGRSFVRYLVEKSSSRREAIFSGDYQDSGIEMPFHSIMVIPMENSGEINGFVVMLHRESYAFSFDKFKLMQSIIRHSTLAFVNTILKEQLQKAASTDYLTQLYSRNYLDKKIVDHMEKGEVGSLILFDIDDFKKVNDTHGHYIGDEVIKQVADIIMSTIEEQDIAARWGGEELAIYLPNTDLNDGVQLARNISNQVENFTDPRVTLSAGVTSWTSKLSDTPKQFFVRADKALYEAKGFGKNCVVKFAAEEGKSGEKVGLGYK